MDALGDPATPFVLCREVGLFRSVLYRRVHCKISGDQLLFFCVCVCVCVCSAPGGVGMSGLLDQYHRKQQHLSGGGGSGVVGGPLSIPALIAAGSAGGTRQEDSDDDYD